MTRDDLILSAIPAAKALARRGSLRGPDADEALSVALAALVVAADKFDPAQYHTGADGWPAFAAQRIKWALADWSRSQLHSRRKSKPHTLLGDTDPGADPRAGDPAEEADIRGKRPCTHCKRLLPPTGFYPATRMAKERLRSWCRLCVTQLSRRLRRTSAYRLWLADYLARPDIRARRLQADRERSTARKPQQKTYRQTARAKLLHCRRQARFALNRASDPARRAALKRLIAGYTAEIDRLRAKA